MIQLIVFIFINSALLTISTPTSAILPTNNELSNEAHHSSDIIFDDTQSETEPKLEHNKNFSPGLLKNVFDTLRFPSDVNKDNKVKSDNNRQQKIIRDILGE